MGEGKAIVIINNSYCYLIENGHNNSAYNAIQFAIEKHKKKIEDKIDYLKKSKIKDDTGHPGWLSVEKDINETKVYWLDE